MHIHKSMSKAAYCLLLIILFAADISRVPETHAATVLNAPFSAQAPFGIWEQPWQDFCEEASVAMAAHFIWKLPLEADIAATEMLLIQQYEGLVLGKDKDTSIDETAQVLRVLYGFGAKIQTRLIRDIADIKRELAAGHLVIIPAAGRLLKNPYFQRPGPVYHMLAITGFDDERGVFITNDPGTRRGKGFVYPQQRLWRAIHDWNNGDVLHGEKKMIVVTG
ncbi:MAG: C39 family peptidase [Candidatus Sungbacteria bacterium]|nr:C39 family peptidase [Candidatus Sungbacteria bacterium]